MRNYLKHYYISEYGLKCKYLDKNSDNRYFCSLFEEIGCWKPECESKELVRVRNKKPNRRECRKKIHEAQYVGKLLRKEYLTYNQRKRKNDLKEWEKEFCF